MRRRRGLASRIVLATALCAVLGFATSRFVWQVVMRAAIARFIEPQTKYLYGSYERARCEADPASWSMSMGRGATTYAYDGATLASRNPAAPPLDRAVWDRVAHGEDPSVAVDAYGRTLASGGVLVFRGASDGPCAIMQTTWPKQDLHGEFVAWVSAGALFAAAAAAVLGFFLLVPPVERIEKHRKELARHLADVAHDLKTPIASLHLAVEQAIDANHDEEVAPLLASALGDAVYLAALTSNLRLASEMREGWDPGSQGAKVDLTEVVDRVVTRARFFAKRKGIALECAVPDGATMAGCDPVAAEQALSNVVENAVTHGESGEHVAVLLEKQGEGFVLTVVDDGPGVPDAELPRLGERTFRSDEARRRDPRGSGLGLAITSEVCARCGWKLTFDREKPRGLRVTVRGPCRV